jgi:hypothetical protein
MARRLVPIAAVLAALALGGCAYGTAARITPAQDQARIRLIEAHGHYSDRDLARLCPGLYPADFLTNTSKWTAGKKSSDDLSASAIARARTREAAALRAAACDVRPG